MLKLNLNNVENDVKTMIADAQALFNTAAELSSE